MAFLSYERLKTKIFSRASEVRMEKKILSFIFSLLYMFNIYIYIYIYIYMFIYYTCLIYIYINSCAILIS